MTRRSWLPSQASGHADSIAVESPSPPAGLHGRRRRLPVPRGRLHGRHGIPGHGRRVAPPESPDPREADERPGQTDERHSEPHERAGDRCHVEACAAGERLRERVDEDQPAADARRRDQSHPCGACEARASRRPREKRQPLERVDRGAVRKLGHAGGPVDLR